MSSKSGKSKGCLWAVVALLVIVGVVFYAFGSIGSTARDDEGEVVERLTPEFIAAVEKYDEIYSFSEGFAPVVKDGKFGCINTKGEEVIPHIFDAANPFSNGVAVVRIGEKWKYTDKEGK